MPQPQVTIGIPVYNGEAFLAAALDSLLNQSYTNFKIIISDNASQDLTEEIARSYMQQDSRIHYERLKENIGAIGNFNRIFRFCDTEYFKWAASDDICKPTYLENCVDVLDKDPSVIWCHSQSGKIDEKGAILPKDDPRAESLSHTSHAGMPRENSNSALRHRRFRGVLLGTSWCADSYGVIRANALRKTKLYPACFGAEKVLIGALSLQGNYAEIPHTLFYQRIHPKAASSVRMAADQQTYMDTNQSARLAATRLRLLKGYLDAVLSTPMSTIERAQCLMVVAQYLFQAKKWKRVLKELLTGRGLGQTQK